MKQLPVLKPGDKPRKATWSVRKDSDSENHKFFIYRWFANIFKHLLKGVEIKLSAVSGN